MQKENFFRTSKKRTWEFYYQHFCVVANHPDERSK